MAAAVRLPRTKTRRQGSLIVIAGAPGSGKSTAADVLVDLKHPKTPFVLDKDTLFHEIDEAVLTHNGGSVADMQGNWYDQSLKPSEYASMFETAKVNRDNGADVILVAPFTTYVSSTRNWNELVRKSGGGNASLIWISASQDVRLARMTARGEERDQAFLADADSFAGRFRKAPRVKHYTINNTADGTEGLSDQLNAALIRIELSTLPSIGRSFSIADNFGRMA